MEKTTRVTSISSALNLVEIKKDNLRKAFEQLQSHPSLSLSSISLSWPDLDSHFTSIQSSLNKQFNLLQSSRTPIPPDPSTSNYNSAPPEQQSDPIRSKLKQELCLLCERMDGKGLKKLIMDLPFQRNSIREDLKEGLKLAEDPGLLVLDAIEGCEKVDNIIIKNKSDRECGMMRDCVMLLEALMGVVEEEEGGVSEEAKGKAKGFAMEWRGKVSKNGEDGKVLEALGFLNLVACFGLAGEFDVGEIVELVVVVAKNRQAIVLCRALKIVDKVPDVIQKLISTGKQLLAVKFIFEFGLTDKFPPVPILKDHVKDAKKISQDIRKKGNHSLQSLNESASKEVNALKSVIKYIEDHNLQSEYPREILENRLETIEKNKKDRKRPAPTPTGKLPQNKQLKLHQPQKRWQQPQKNKPKPQQLGGNKLPQPSAPSTARANPNNATTAGMNVAPHQPPHLQQSGLLPDQPAPYAGSSVTPYGLAGSNSTFTPYPGSTPMVATYGGSSVGPYSVVGGPLGFLTNPRPNSSHLYPSHFPPAHYNGPTAYGEYSLPPQYHPSYYPQ